MPSADVVRLAVEGINWLFRSCQAKPMCCMKFSWETMRHYNSSQLANTYSSGKEMKLKVSCVKPNNQELQEKVLKIKWQEKIA